MNIPLVSDDSRPQASAAAPHAPSEQWLVDSGKLTPEDVERVARLQRKQRLSFSDAALRLRLVSRAQVEQARAQQFGYPYLEAGRHGLSEALTAACQPSSPQAEALRALRGQLQMRWFENGNKALAVMAANAGDGCSALAANLAIVFSHLGEKTLLVDADLRQPVQHQLFGLPGAAGLADILAGRAGLDAAGRIDGLPQLSVLAAGTVPPNPQELLSRRSFADFMREARQSYGVVIVDTAPAAASADAQVVASRCGGAVLASRLNRTRLEDLANVRDQLLLGGAQLVAAIVL